MIIITPNQIDDLELIDHKLSTAEDFDLQIKIQDHLGGFDSDYQNLLLDRINKFAQDQQRRITVHTSYILEPCVTKHYEWLEFKLIIFSGWKQFEHYHTHPELAFQNFVCSFNGTPHVSRKLLVSALNKFNYFNQQYCSKNFFLSPDVLDGHVHNYVDSRAVFYNKFFSFDADFLKSVYSFDYDRYNHKQNIYNLENKLTQSFLHIVSETMATSSVSFVTEKFLYSVVTRGLFLAYAQPGWHAHVEKCFGFKRYTKLFDYRFDSIQNPVERLVELMTMISKFSKLSLDDWRDLYHIEQDTIEYNYHHYFSGNYLKHLKKYE
jgi:hypothetical protein